jgi:hypothetical protein
MATSSKTRVYVSHSTKAGNMLALWVDHRPSCDKDQTDPDGWVSGVVGTPYEIERLCELSKVPGADVTRVHETAAEWWDRIERGRKTAASKARRAKLAGAQSMFAIDPELEEAGRREGAERVAMKKRVRKAS